MFVWSRFVPGYGFPVGGTFIIKNCMSVSVMSVSVMKMEVGSGGMGDSGMCGLSVSVSSMCTCPRRW